MIVLAKSLQVFMPDMGVWQAIQTFETPQGVIEFLLGNGMQAHNFRQMLVANSKSIEKPVSQPRALPSKSKAPSRSYQEAKNKSKALFEDNAGSKRARVTRAQSPELDSEDGTDWREEKREERHPTASQ